MDAVTLTERLVAIDSQNPGAFEGEIAAFVEDHCRAAGIEVRRLEYVTGRPNLLLTVDRGPGRHLGLCGHLDTKPIGQALGDWRTDSFRLTIDGDLAYGLGTSDMKGAVAAMLVALERFGQSGPRGVLSAIITADEEQGSNAGAKALVRANALPPLDAIVIGEPSGIDEPWEAIHLVSRGIACFLADVRTEQGHSGLSSRYGRNAILVAADLLTAFEHFVPTVREPGPVPCSPSVNSGMLIHGGVTFGTWPGWCQIGAEIRLVPGMNREEVQPEVEEFLAREAGARASVEVRWLEGSQGWMPPVGLSPDASVVRACQAAARQVFGHELPVAAYPGGTDATYLMGEAGIPTVAALGPGWLSVAHGANECIGVGQVTDSVELYSILASQFLGAPLDDA